MAQLVDFHCHLDLYPNFEALVDTCERAGIYTLTVTTTPRAWQRNRSLTEKNSFVKAALGLHPQLIGQFEGELPLWERYLDETKFVGEVGLDAGPRYYKTLPTQVRVFQKVAESCAASGGKVLSVHSVRTVKEVLDILEKAKVFHRNKVVLHWFTGTLTEARRAIELGCYLSINEQMLFNEKGKELVSIIPRGKLLTETDGPFTQNENVPKLPKDVASCLQRIAMIVRQPLEVVQEQVAKNATSLLGH